MGFPFDSLTPVPVAGNFLAPRNGIKPLLEGYERGGIALQDNSAGLLYQDWTAAMVGQDVVLTAGLTGFTGTILTIPDPVSEIDLAFDQNMNPQIAYVAGGIAKLWYYDTPTDQYQTLTLEAGASNPRVTLDDKRAAQESVSDVLLMYILERNLVMRKQRDRFLTTIPLTQFGFLNGLRKIGMGDNLRMMMEIY